MTVPGYGSQNLFPPDPIEEPYLEHSGRPVSPALLELLKGQELYTAWLFTDKYGAIEAGPTANLEEAAIVTSKVRKPVLSLDPGDFFTPEQHYLAIDIDMEAHLVPSSTPGHNHLYIKHPLTKEQLFEVLEVLAKVGIVEKGYANACIERGWTTLRLPWVSKGQVPVQTGGD